MNCYCGLQLHRWLARDLNLIPGFGVCLERNERHGARERIKDLARRLLQMFEVHLDQVYLKRGRIFRRAATLFHMGVEQAILMPRPRRRGISDEDCEEVAHPRFGIRIDILPYARGLYLQVTEEVLDDEAENVDPGDRVTTVLEETYISQLGRRVSAEEAIPILGTLDFQR